MVNKEYRAIMYKLCRKKGLMPEMIAKITNYSRSMIYAVCNGNPCTYETLKAVADTLDIPYDKLLVFRYKCRVPMGNKEKADLLDNIFKAFFENMEDL